MKREYVEKMFNRFLPKVNIPADVNQCWTWKAAVDKDGYGKFKVKVDRKGAEVFRNIGAHRFMWEYHHGEIPNGFIVLHSCDNPSCVNPSHLKLGTYKENSQDRDKKGRSNHARGSILSFPGERNGHHKLTNEQVSYIRKRYAIGDVSQQQIADEVGVSQPNISRIVLGKNW